MGAFIFFMRLYKKDLCNVGSLTMTEASTRCEDGGKEQCSSMDCGEFWIKMAQVHGAPAK